MKTVQFIPVPDLNYQKMARSGKSVRKHQQDPVDCDAPENNALGGEGQESSRSSADQDGVALTCRTSESEIKAKDHKAQIPADEVKVESEKPQSGKEERKKTKKEKGQHVSHQTSHSEQGDDKEVGNSSEKSNRVRIAFLKERCAALIQRGEYKEASNVLKEIRTLHDSDGLDTQLQTIECELQSAGSNSEAYIKGVKEMLIGTDTLATEDVRSLASELDQGNKNIRGIILHRITVDMVKMDEITPNEVADYMRERAYDISHASKVLIKSGGRSRDIGIEYGTRYLKEILAELRALENVDPTNKAEKEAKCLTSLTFVYLTAGLHRKSVEFAEEGLAVLDKQFGASASKIKSYGWLLNNLGTAHHNSCQYSAAESYYITAIKAYENATDFVNEHEKKREIELAKSNLANTRKQLGKHASPK